MKNIATILVLVILAAQAHAVSEKDQSAAVFYMQSVALPMLTDNCREVWPEFDIVYSIALERWQETNRKMVKRGEKVTSKQLSLKGAALRQEMESGAKAMLKEIQASSPEIQKSQCTDMLETLVSEL